jgi:hypothetical protein
MAVQNVELRQSLEQGGLAGSATFPSVSAKSPKINL